jgi:hypothetical protein
LQDENNGTKVLDVAFGLQAVVALVSEIPGDGAGFLLQTSE